LAASFIVDLREHLGTGGYEPHEGAALVHREPAARLTHAWCAVDARARHRHHRWRASCARTRHAVTFRSQANKHLFGGNTPPWGLGHRVHLADWSSHRTGTIACAGELNSPAMPMRVIATRRCRAMVDTPGKTIFLQSVRSGRGGGEDGHAGIEAQPDWHRQAATGSGTCRDRPVLLCLTC